MESFSFGPHDSPVRKTWDEVISDAIRRAAPLLTKMFEAEASLWDYMMGTYRHTHDFFFGRFECNRRSCSPPEQRAKNERQTGRSIRIPLALSQNPPTQGQSSQASNAKRWR